jgi:hypothetical protein
VSFLGQDDGGWSLYGVRATTEARVAEARRAGLGLLRNGRWPSAGTVARVVLVLIAAVVIMGWVLTAANR